MKRTNNRVGLFFLWILFIGFATAAQASSVSLEYAGPQIYAGDPFEVSVYANDFVFPNAIVSFGFDVNYDASYLRYGGATLNATHFVPDAFSSNDVAGTIMSAPPGPGGLPPLAVSGDHILLATLIFTADQAAEDDLLIGILLGSVLTNNLSKPMVPIVDNICLSVAPAAVPVPPTVLLLGSGLLALFSTTRKKIIT